jgi:hypothetical protein
VTTRGKERDRIGSVAMKDHVNDPCADENTLYIDSHVNILFVILDYSLASLYFNSMQKETSAKLDIGTEFVLKKMQNHVNLQR